MVTNSGTYVDQNTVKYELTGLSTDQKPTVTYDGKKIANGSTFLEMDTKDVKFYDAAANAWK